jgi:hypothetical protein
VELSVSDEVVVGDLNVSLTSGRPWNRRRSWRGKRGTGGKGGTDEGQDEGGGTYHDSKQRSKHDNITR